MKILNKNQYGRTFVFISMLVSASAESLTSKECYQAAKTGLEKVYCQILEKGAGGKLPSFNDFQRNTASTQKLILLGPAKKLGITMPEITKAKRAPSPLGAGNPNTRPSPEPVLSEEKPAQRDKKNTSSTASIGDCDLRQNKIICPRQSYFLAINIPINRLAKETLAETNRLSFRNQFPNESKLQYLSDVYPYYIEKMLTIGLGDSTVSFTKFNAIFEETEKQNEDFSIRFSKMYELLKNERRTMAIKTRYRNNFPDNISQCMQLNQRLVACDNIEQNWVYRRLMR